VSNPPKNKAINFNLIKRILSYTKPYKKLFFVAIAITLTLSTVAIVRPLLISYTLNEFVTKQKNLTGLNLMCLLILFSLITEALLQIVNLRITNLLGQNIVKDLRSQVYKHIISLKNTYFDNTPVGMLVTRAISDIESLSDVFAQGFIVIAGDIIMLIVFVTVMLFKNWVLSLLAFTTIPLLFIATALFKRGIKKTFNQVRNAVANLNTFTQEHIMGMRLVQLFNREEQELDKFKEINKQHRVANINSIFYYSVFFPIVEILSSISIALVIWFAGVNTNSLQISLGDITFFVMMINMVFRPIRMLADRLNTLQMGFVSAERVFKVIDTDEKINDSGTIPFHQVKQDIEFKNVWFAYKDDNFVLKNVSFKIEAGKTVAMIGATGAGKSTIINLLSRFYEYNKGEILMDGIEIKNYELSSLRKNTGVVLQDVHLFNDTILNNITLNNPEITLLDVEEATKQIGLYEYVMSLPDGFNYQVTERGQSLSAGQRQLIAFIRAYVYQPSIFILDEATATIDTQTEILIQKATQKISEGRTSIVIAHRLSTIKHVDKILVFDNGGVVEEGSITELLGRDSRFKKMYELNYDSEILIK
jgi:ATP-binding cassette subfamily B multidrug efflux pump